MLRLRTFGVCQVERDGVRLEAISAARRALALLGLVAASGERGISRDRAIALFWPESDEERGRSSLRQLVHSIRSQLDLPELLPSTGELRLEIGALANDVADFRDAVSRRDWRAAAAQYRGPFLDAFTIRGLDELDRAIAAERAALDADAARVFEELAMEAAASGELDARVEWCRRRLAVDRLSARANVALMDALEAAGDRSAALAHARVYELLLRDELDAPPDPLVRAATERISAAPSPVASAPVLAPVLAPVTGGAEPLTVPGTTGTTGGTADSAAIRPRRWAGWTGVALIAVAIAGASAWLATRSPTPPAAASFVRDGSVAVLPFTNVSAILADEPFVEGLTDELISQLGQVPGVRVIGRTSVFALRGLALSPRAIGDTLGVRTVVEGSWRRQGDRLKVTARLVDAATGEVLWSDAFDRELRDVMGAQESIAQGITAALQPRLRTSATVQARDDADIDVPRSASTSTRDAMAYERYVIGRHLLRTRSDREGIELAARRFQEATGRDSGYAAAYAGYSDAMTRLAVFGLADPQVGYREAIDAARRAVALDTGLADAHASLGHALLVSRFQWRAADSAFRRAIALDPSLAYARSTYALSLATQGRYPESLAQLDTARVADPLSLSTNNLTGRVLLLADRPREAIRVLLSVLEITPASDLAMQQLGHAYLRLGDSANALDRFRRAARMSGGRDSAQLAYALATFGRADEASRVIAAVRASPAALRTLPAHLAMAYAALGQRDSAFVMLERGYRTRASFMIGVPGEPAFRPLHEDARWAGLVRRMKEGW